MDPFESCETTIEAEDRVAAGAYNAIASSEFKLQTQLGPMPHFGAIECAPLVLLIAHPRFDGASTLHELSFRRPGWPLAALHPDAPAALRDAWHERLEHLIVAFGEHAVSNAVAALTLTPWASARFDRDLRLPSRRRMLAMAGAVAHRGALVLITCEPALWTESPEIASLPAWRSRAPCSWRSSAVHPARLGDAAWSLLCSRVEDYLRERPLRP
jgi:hypothetical protein